MGIHSIKNAIKTILTPFRILSQFFDFSRVYLNLRLFHSDSEWEKIFEHAKNVANVNGIEISFPKPTRQKRVPLYLEGYITNTLSCSRDPLSNSNLFKDYLYFPILDCFIEELDKRFNAKNLNLMRAIHAFQPDSAEFLNAEFLKGLSVCYYLDHESLTLETILARRAIVNYEMDSIRDVLIELIPLKVAFPNLIK